MSIRNYKSEDFERLVEIYNLSKSDEFSGEASIFEVIPLTEDKQMLKLFEESKIFVYEKGSILGFAGHKENYISWLFVHPDHRGNKIGKLLISHILSNLRGVVALNVAHSNLAAKKLYQKLGFTVKKEFEGKYQDKPIIVNRMEYEV